MKYIYILIPLVFAGFLIILGILSKIMHFAFFGFTGNVFILGGSLLGAISAIILFIKIILNNNDTDFYNK